MGWDSQETTAIRRLQNCFELFTDRGEGVGDKKGITPYIYLFFRLFVYSWPILLSVCFIKKETHFQRRFISHFKFCLKVEQLLWRRHDNGGRSFDCLLLNPIPYRNGIGKIEQEGAKFCMCVCLSVRVSVCLSVNKMCRPRWSKIYRADWSKILGMG